MDTLIFFAKGMAVVFLLLGAGAAYLAHSQAQHASQLQQEGVDATAKVVKKYVVTTTRTSSSGHPTSGIPDHMIEYSFPVSGGETFTKRENLPEDFWKTLKEGQEVSVRYWSQDPTICTIQEDGFARGAAMLNTGWKILFGLTALCMLFVWAVTRNKTGHGP